MTAQNLEVCLVQSDIVWEDISANLSHTQDLLQRLDHPVDIIVLPEMFSTGFSSNAIDLADTCNGDTLCKVKAWAATYQSLVMGSFIATENGKYYNRGFAVYPDGKTLFYDKKHLFFGGEKTYFTPGHEQLVLDYKGWKLGFCICYDLRFPVWLRNYQLRYDALFCVAEWPNSRQRMLEYLSVARAIENQAYLCLCNRVGSDGNFFQYTGGSQCIDYKGKVLFRCNDNQEQLGCFTLERYRLESYREKAPIWMDADPFSLQ